MYIQIKNINTFVYTNLVIKTMKIEDEIKSTIPINIAKKVLLNISFTKNVLHDNFQELIKPYDLSGEQYNVLRILRGQKGKPVNMCDIQERMIAKNSNTTRLINKLLLKKMVTRSECPENRRKIEILITQKGLEILEKLDPAVIEHENHFANKLTVEELEKLNNLLEKYRN
ncbi:putative transcriptional regulator, MarR-family [Flavobacterium psychrophilum]|nr:Transcriptional regulator, MarR family protein [Flavobacterium psychrophilum]SCY22332.1 transcriptional regulator, MarR family [Flavobacterium psychrophilum DSM 3660] [Flavobacterium psychrophilum DSM 3660 = ATCC 49418]SNA29588.1 putative transcriptional regulator, MarR-family [Flavobacterium psychrophilum]SNA69844.1 putative transcriptional regulator, MarR-family [Flavobacterium psychrophilum]SNA69952.1 putative transcriptional regulator, MarR-family [Flavobacterium psychrophilum]